MIEKHGEIIGNTIHLDTGHILVEQKGLSGLVTRVDIPVSVGDRRYVGSRENLEQLFLPNSPTTDAFVTTPEWDPTLTKQDVSGF